MKFYVIALVYFFITGFCSQMKIEEFQRFTDYNISSGDYHIDYNEAVEDLFIKNLDIINHCNARKKMILTSKKKKVENLDFNVETFCFGMIIDITANRVVQENNEIIDWYFYQDWDLTKKNSLGENIFFSVINFLHDDINNYIIASAKKNDSINFNESEFYRTLEKYMLCYKEFVE